MASDETVRLYCQVCRRIPSSSSSSAMKLPLPPPPPPWIPSSSASSAMKLPLPPPPPPWIPSSSASSSSSTTLPRTPPSPCTRASSSSTGPPPPPTPTTSSGTTTSSAAPVPYYCPKHFAVATREGPPFPLFPLQRCPNCRVHDFQEDGEHPVSSSSSSTVSPISSAYSSASSSPLWPPPVLYRGELQPGLPPLTLERADFVDDANVGLQPAPIARITRLPVVTVADNEVLCALCTNRIVRRAPLSPCGYDLHTSCLVPSLLRHNSCPVWDCQCSIQASPPPSPPRQPPPPSPLTSSRPDTWDYFFGPSAEEPAPPHRVGPQMTPRTQPPPVSIYASLVDSPVHCSGSQAALLPPRPPTPRPPVSLIDSPVHRGGSQAAPLPPSPPRLPTPRPPVSLINSPVHRGGSQAAPLPPSPPWLPTPRPPVSLIDSPVHRRASQAAPAASIAALPIVTVSDTAEFCAVCTESLPLATVARRLPCGHLYHSDCIVPWLSRHNSCPVCRRSIPMFPSTTTETAPSPSPPPALPQPTPGRRRSLPGARRIRRICHRLLRYMEISRARQPTSSDDVHL